MVRKRKFDFIANELTPAIRARAEKGLADAVQGIIEDHGLATYDVTVENPNGLNDMHNRITKLEHDVEILYNQETAFARNARQISEAVKNANQTSELLDTLGTRYTIEQKV
jgi:hypothetical protein